MEKSINKAKQKAQVEPEELVNNRLSTVAEAYSSIWGPANGVVNVPEDQWMSIPTLPEAKSEPAEVYPLSPEDRKFVDNEFDRLHQQGKMSWTTGPTPYAYPCFVVWRTINIHGKPPERKGRVVIDIRELNKISMFDAYPMTLQKDIISAVLGCPKPQEGQRCLHKALITNRMATDYTRLQ